MQRIVRIAARVGAALAVFLFTFSLGQDFLIFPGLRLTSREQYMQGRVEDYRGWGLQSRFIAVGDGKRLEAWYLPAAPQPGRRRAAILFHGMGGDLPGHFRRQLMFQSMGISSFAVSFRGHDRSSGWPSEKGIEFDAEALWDYAIEREHLDPGEIIVVGESFGTGPAAYLAQKRGAGSLLLLAPYIDLQTAASRSNRFYKLLSPLMWYKFPTIDYMKRMDNTCVISAHGERDQVIPHTDTLMLARAYRGRGGFHAILVPDAMHEDLFTLRKDEIVQKLATCRSHSPSSVIASSFNEINEG